MSRVSTRLNLTEGTPAVSMLSNCATKNRSNLRRGNPLVEQTPRLMPREHPLSLIVWRVGSPSRETLKRLDEEEQRAAGSRARQSTAATTTQRAAAAATPAATTQRAAAVAVVTPEQGGGDGDGDGDERQAFDSCAVKVLSYQASISPLLLLLLGGIVLLSIC